MRTVLNRILNLIIFVTSFTLIAISVTGGVLNFTPVPFWDMINGYLDFYVKLSTGDWSAWWRPHNEHRVIISRVLFWVDIAIFNGHIWFLIACNYICVFFSAIVFYRFLKESSISREKSTIFTLGIFFTAWLFSWSQQENLTWGFQSQFFLAQLIPLLAFYLLYKSTLSCIGSTKYFIWSCLTGIAAIGTMANGIITLPLMIVYAIILGQGWKRITTLAVLSMLAITTYFYNYTPPSNNSVLTALTSNPEGLAAYILLYIGGPFQYLFPQGKAASIAAYASGGFLILGTFFLAIKSIFSSHAKALRLALIFFIIYIGGTALGTAGGRLYLGVNQALSSRYMTPSLMAWVAFFILALSFYYETQKNDKKTEVLKILVVCLLGLLLPYQVKALNPDNDVLYEKRIAALALEMRIKDRHQISKIFPSVEGALHMTDTPVNENLSIFNASDIRDVSESIGVKTTVPVTNQCIGTLDSVTSVDYDPRYVQVSGWIFDPINKSPPNIVQILSSDSVISGYALTGQKRVDIANAVRGKALYSGFKGYLLKEQLGSSVTLMGNSQNCWLKADIPEIFYTVKKLHPVIDGTDITTTNIISNNGWNGTDSWKTKISKMTVIGSWVNSDADVGDMTLSLKKGDRIFYRSGPKGGRQRLEIEGSRQNPVVLPVAEEWVQIEFSGESVPNTFQLKISDSGDGWGEWSAIAINSNKQAK
jgi:hypothetical protein